MKRSLAVLLISAMAGSLVLFAAPASAQYGVTLQCNFVQVFAGTKQLQCTGDGYEPGSTITLHIDDKVFPNVPIVNPPAATAASVESAAVIAFLPSAVADANGVFVQVFDMPDDIATGFYLITSTGIGVDGEPRTLQWRFEVIDRAGVGPIAFTGSSSRPIAEIVIAMIALGGLAVVVARRRTATQAAARTSV